MIAIADDFFLEVGEVSSGGGLERGELGEVVTDEQGNQIVFRKIEVRFLLPTLIFFFKFPTVIFFIIL